MIWNLRTITGQWVGWISIYSSGPSFHSANWWFGARWFGIRFGRPLSNNPGFIFGDPIGIQTHRAPNHQPKPLVESMWTRKKKQLACWCHWFFAKVTAKVVQAEKSEHRNLHDFEGFCFKTSRRVVVGFFPQCMGSDVRFVVLFPRWKQFTYIYQHRELELFPSPREFIEDTDHPNRLEWPTMGLQWPWGSRFVLYCEATI